MYCFHHHQSTHTLEDQNDWFYLRMALGSGENHLPPIYHFQVLLLMIQKSNSQPPYGYIKPWQIMGVQLPTFPSTGEFTGFLNHQQYVIFLRECIGFGSPTAVAFASAAHLKLPVPQFLNEGYPKIVYMSSVYIYNYKSYIMYNQICLCHIFSIFIHILYAYMYWISNRID